MKPNTLGVNPITFSPDGRLIVGLCFLGDGLYELDPSLVAEPRPIIVATGFAIPAAVKFDPQGRLHVVDQSGEVFRVDHVTGEKTVIAVLEEGLDNLAFDARGNLYISSADHGWMAQVLPFSGRGRALSPGGLIGPMGVAILQGPDGQDKVFVADLWRLREFDGLTGRPGNVFKGHLVPVEGSLTTPFSLSADGEHLVVSSWSGGAVQVWDPQTDQVLEHYPMPAPLTAIRLQDDLVVADLGLGGVVWASDHAMILAMDGVNVFLPAGLATDGKVLWVADWATGIVWQIGFDGKSPLAAVPVATGLVHPEGLAVDGDGSLLVVEVGAKRLSRIDLGTGEVSVVADGLEIGLPGPEGYPPIWLFNGVAVGPSGDIYVTGDVTNVLYRIPRR